MGKLKPEYRALANPKQMRKFLDGQGILADRQQVAEHFDYDWHARTISTLCLVICRSKSIRSSCLMAATGNWTLIMRSLTVAMTLSPSDRARSSPFLSRSCPCLKSRWPASMKSCKTNWWFSVNGGTCCIATDGPSRLYSVGCVRPWNWITLCLTILSALCAKS